MTRPWVLASKESITVDSSKVFEIVDVRLGLRNLLVVLLFARAQFSAALSFFSSSLSLASSSDKYSLTVPHPPCERSAIRINLFRFLSESLTDKIFFFALL